MAIMPMIAAANAALVASRTALQVAMRPRPRHMQKPGSEDSEGDRRAFRVKDFPRIADNLLTYQSDDGAEVEVRLAALEVDGETIKATTVDGQALTVPLDRIVSLSWMTATNSY